MPILPVAAVISVRIDGQKVRAYAPAYVVAGRTYAPLLPFVTRLADRVGYEGQRLVVVRGLRHVSVSLGRISPDGLDRAYVPLAPVLRGLGETVRYDPKTHTVDVHSPQAMEVASPVPYDPLAPQAVPRIVFTPAPPPARHIVWHGPATPRRTPLPYPIPT